MTVASRADEERPFTPECYALSELQYYKAQPGESFTKPDCPLVTLKAQAEAAASGSGGKDHGVGWRQVLGAWGSTAEGQPGLFPPETAAGHRK